MRFLRLLTNALAGGVLGALYLLVIVLLINPQVPALSSTTARWFGALVSFYGLHLSIALLLGLLLLEVLLGRAIRPGWLSVRLLAWVGAALAAASAVITWANLQGFRAVLGEPAAQTMQMAAVAATVCALALVVIAIVRYSFGRKGSRPAGVLLVITLLASVAAPLWIRGPGPLPVPLVPPSPQPAVAPSSVLASVAPRVKIVAVDGASLGVIREQVAAGRLPNIGRVLDRGAVINLATLKPTQAEPVWTAAATGRYPAGNGVRSNAEFRVSPDGADAVDLLPDYCFAYALVYQQYVTAVRRTRDDVRARPFWQIAADYGLAAGIVRWPLTFPAELSRGYLISGQFHAGLSSPLRLSESAAGVPTSAVEIAREVFERDTEVSGDPQGAAAPAELAFDEDLRAGWDRRYQEAAARLESFFSPHVSALRLTGVDVVSHPHWNAVDPARSAGGRVGDAAIVDAAYQQLDASVGRARDQLRPGDLLLVMSGFGMEAVSTPKRLLARLLQQPNLTGSHEGAPDGFLIAYGRDVVHTDLPRGSVVDLAPTVLYFLGIPVGRDMDGYARTDLFTRAFRREHPLTFISSHER